MIGKDFRTLLLTVNVMGCLTRNTVSFKGRRLEKLSVPTPGQRRVFELLGKPIPLRLDAA
jgi:hypothetical protein